MKHLILSLVAAVSFMNVAQADVSVDNVNDPKLAGAWRSAKPVYKDNNMNVFLGLKFRATDADMSAICQFPKAKKTLEASITGPVNVADGKIELLAGGEMEVKEGNYTCSVQMEPGTVEYKFVGKTLRLISEGQAMDFVPRK